jgi:ACS family hexuronate transporter-like MFS transporter
MTRVRWWMLALVFFATTINYLDRILFANLIPLIRADLNIDNKDYGWINGAFQITYTIGFLAAGKLVDRYGTRIGYAFSLVWWSLAAMAHAAAQSGWSLAFWRGMLGLGESGNFPAAMKAVAEWFPRKDRGLATGIFNAGTNVASMIGPPVFVWIAAAAGWRVCFLAIASTGFVWLVFWCATFRSPQQHPGVNAAELAYIHSDPPATAARIGLAEAIRHKQTWGFGLAKFLADPVWWFYLYWIPPYLYDVRKFNMSEIGWSLPFIYLMADVGSVAGGWFSGFLLRRGWPVAKARKTALAVCACLMPVGAASVLVEDPIVCILLISVATSAHQGWSANVFTTATDLFPKAAMATVTGFGGCLGGIGGFFFSAVLPGYVVTHFGYTPVFVTLGTFHLIALAIVHSTMGDMRPIEIKQ